MSKLIITGIVGIVALGGLAVLPQISTAAATSTYVAPTDVSYETKPAVQPTVSVGFGQGSYYAPAFAANRQASLSHLLHEADRHLHGAGPEAGDDADVRRVTPA